ncbi:MAG: hypothetical protein ACXVA4_06030 [Ktedonobacterales bacterium]
MPERCPVQRCLDISAGRDTRKILMVPALGHQQAVVMAGPEARCVEPPVVNEATVVGLYRF